MTDNDFLLHVLSDGQWHSRDDILAQSFRERGCGMTVHSRVADLRDRGHSVECKVSGGSRRASFYRLVGALEEASLASMAGGVSSSASSPAESLAASGEDALTNREGNNGWVRGDGLSSTASSEIGTGALPSPDAPPDLTLFAAPRGAYGD